MKHLLLAYLIIAIIILAAVYLHHAWKNHRARRLTYRMRELYQRGQWEARNGHNDEAARYFGRLHGEQALAGRSRRVKKQKVNVFRKTN
jgi:hypothetical protein